MFDATINISTLIQTVGIVGSVAFFVWKMHARLDVMDVKLTAVVGQTDKLDQELSKLTEVTIALAKQEQRLDSFEQRLGKVEVTKRSSRR